MTTYSRQVYRVGPDSTETLVELYQQPRIDRVKFMFFNAVWLTSWKVRPVHWLIMRYVDLQRRRHARVCDDSCGTGHRYNGPGRDPGPPIRMCTWMDLDIRMDLKHFDLDHKNNVRVTEWPNQSPSVS